MYELQHGNTENISPGKRGVLDDFYTDRKSTPFLSLNLIEWITCQFKCNIE